MSELIERVTDAIVSAWGHDPADFKRPPQMAASHEDMERFHVAVEAMQAARAAVEAMRPEFAYLRQHIIDWADEHGCCAGVETEALAMIDVALGES